MVCAKVNDTAVTASGRRSVDIAVWLRGLGLEQYEAAFRANAIDASVLPRLTAEDLTGCGKSRSVVLPPQFVAFCPFVTR